MDLGISDSLMRENILKGMLVSGNPYIRATAARGAGTNVLMTSGFTR